MQFLFNYNFFGFLEKGGKPLNVIYAIVFMEKRVFMLLVALLVLTLSMGKSWLWWLIFGHTKGSSQVLFELSICRIYLLRNVRWINQHALRS